MYFAITQKQFELLLQRGGIDVVKEHKRYHLRVNNRGSLNKPLEFWCNRYLKPTYYAGSHDHQFLGQTYKATVLVKKGGAP